MKHLTDDQIQNYIDRNKQNGDTVIEEHLKQCFECRQSLNIYREIFNKMKLTDSSINLSSDFSKNTMKKLQQLHAKRWDLLENLLITISFIVGIVLIIYFFDLSRFVNLFTTIDFSLITNFGKKLLSSIPGNLFYLSVAVLITSVIELVDRFILNKPIQYSGQ